MNTVIVAFVSGVLGSVATIAVSTVRDGALPGSQEAVLVGLAREMVEKQDQLLSHQHFLRMNIIEMVEAQQAMLHEVRQKTVNTDADAKRSMDFFQKNLGLGDEGQ
jgi:hypothetical protein